MKVRLGPPSLEQGGPQQIRDLSKAALQGCNYSQRNREDTNPRVQEEKAPSKPSPEKRKDSPFRSLHETVLQALQRPP